MNPINALHALAPLPLLMYLLSASFSLTTTNHYRQHHKEPKCFTFQTNTLVILFCLFFLRKGVVVLVLIYCLRIFWVRFRYYHFHFHSYGIFIFWKNLNVSYSATICGLFRRDNLKVTFIKVHSFFF